MENRSSGVSPVANLYTNLRPRRDADLQCAASGQVFPMFPSCGRVSDFLKVFAYLAPGGSECIELKHPTSKSGKSYASINIGLGL